MMKIHYITLWGENSCGDNRMFSPAGLTKAKYVCGVLKDLYGAVHVHSFSAGKPGVKGWLKGFKENVNDLEISHCATFRSENKLGRMVERWMNRAQLLYTLLFKIKREDVTIVYHERCFAPVIRLARKMARRKIIYQIEEVYTQVANYPKKMIDNEIRAFQHADAYILINDLIADYCQLPQDKPRVVLYGPYKVVETSGEKFPDGKIHVVYAGTLASQKGGAAAAAAAAFLPANYHVHILGFGSAEEVDGIKKLIAEVNENTQATVTYDGVMLGEEYENFLSRCHIGLSTQTPVGDYNFTSFPSKVLVYLCHGLTVVSVSLPALTASSISPLITYCDSPTPESIAQAIISLQPIPSQEIAQQIISMDQAFRSTTHQIITSLNR